MPKAQNIKPELSIYAGYSYLPVSAVADLTGALSRMSKRIVSSHSEIARRPQKLFPEFEVITIATGESIKFTFGEGWMPSVVAGKDDDIVIDVPRKLGVPLLIGYLLLSGAQDCLNLRNAHLDSQLKEVELQLKQTELQQTLLSSGNQVADLKHEGQEVVSMIQNTEIYQVFEINGVSILCRENDANDR